MNIYRKTVQTNRGNCILLATDNGICWASPPGTPWTNGEAWLKKIFSDYAVIETDVPEFLNEAAHALTSYFKGKAALSFTGPFDFYGTPFQKTVWQGLLHIPFGRTTTYGQLAKKIGHPKAVRALGAACGANPITILVPCHRVIGSTGKLTGYGGGLPTKEYLLALEQNRLF